MLYLSWASKQLAKVKSSLSKHYHFKKLSDMWVDYHERHNSWGGRTKTLIFFLKKKN